MRIQEALIKIIDKTDLEKEEMISVMTQIMEGQAERSLLAAFLTALRVKGESMEEILGAAIVMRGKSEKINIKADHVVDTCGTGGDNANTFNISTAAAFVVAGCGLTVAKHGNRAVSSRSGSADVLKCLGVNIEADKLTVEKCIDGIGIGFLFAPLMHRAMKHAAEVRKELGFRTIFNLLGPLTNPAGAHAQVIGIYDGNRLKQIASVLNLLGTKHAFVVHGDDGLDEITLTNNTLIAELKNNQINEYVFNPTDFGYEYIKIEDIKGGDPEYNAKCFIKMIEGNYPAFQKIIEINAGAALYLSKNVKDLKEGFDLARKVIVEGKTKKYLEELIN